jgi:hypothetical protein
MKMKKRIVFFVLLIAVAIGMAFADGNVKFSQNVFDERDITITAVWVYNNSRLYVHYTGNKTMPIGRWFIIGCYHKDGSYNEYTNHEALIKDGGNYQLWVKVQDYSSIESVYIWVGPTKKAIDEYRNIGSFKESAPPKEKKSWIDRKFPPLKL